MSNAGHRADGWAHADHRVNAEGRLTDTPRGGDAGALAASPLGASCRPRLKASVDVFTASDGTVYLIHPGADDLMIRSPPEGIVSLLQGLDGTRTRGELTAEYAPSDVDAEMALQQLWDLGLLEDATADGASGLDGGELRRYARQLAYFGELAPPGVHRESLQARLAAAQVTVLGLGGLGCWTAIALACAGIGRLVVVDGDEVEVTNLNRQILYTPSVLGESKARVGARALRSFNPSIDVVAKPQVIESEDDALDAASGSDVVVELADWPVGELTRWVARAARRLRVPHLQASQDPPVLRVGPMFLPGRTGCAECQALAQRQRHELYDEVLAFRSQRREEAATFGPACAIVGGVLANEVVNLLLGLAAPATAGRAATIDLRTLEWAWEEAVAVDPNCPVCSTPAPPG